LVLEGAAEVAGEPLLPGTLLYLAPGRAQLAVTCQAAARLLVIGGVPFAEEVLLWWNFVARNTEEMVAATDDWNAGRRFGAVHGSPSAPLRAPALSGLNLRA
ncbi:MAG TPA: pirin-like C-terminal cupin domain-containing protein, partial [Steroidobacteraceae bacterium]|nr:pirin-like C-terminal cupin domain-containing protein [Steroidobacteraceae bacterium]